MKNIRIFKKNVSKSGLLKKNLHHLWFYYAYCPLLIPLFHEFLLQPKITKCGYPLALAFFVMTEDNDPRISKNFLIYLSTNKCRKKTLALAIVDMCLHKKESPTEQFCHLEHVFKKKRLQLSTKVRSCESLDVFGLKAPQNSYKTYMKFQL